MYILDIECKGDPRLLDVYLDGITAPKTYKDEDKIKAYIEQKKSEARKGMSLDADFAEVICVGIKEIGKTPKLLSLEEFAVWLKVKDENGVENLSKKMITFNGKSFDIPVIIRAGIKAGLDMPYMELAKLCDKYKGHLDLMQELAVGYGNYKSLDKYLQIYLGKSKKPINFDIATEEEIKEHCREDLASTEQLYQKFSPLFL